MVLDDLHVLLPETDAAADPILNILKNRAITLIKNYLNNSSYDAVYIETNFPDAVVQLVYNAYTLKGKENVQSESQGSRSVTYKGFTSYAAGSAFSMTQDIKVLLPLPSIRMR